MALKAPGQIALLEFPQTDLTVGKSRPVLLLARAAGHYDDWLVCMFSTQLQQAILDFDEIVGAEDKDFPSSGLTIPSVIRLARLALVSSNQLLGKIGQINWERMTRIRRKIAAWITCES